MMREPRRLMFVSDAPHFGGAERYALDAAAAMQQRGGEAEILWLRTDSAEPGVFDAARSKGVHVTIIPSDQTRSAVGVVRSVGQALRAYRPSGVIVNACGRKRMWMIPWIARSMSINSVWVHHMVDGRDPRRMAPTRCGGRIEGVGMWRWPQALRHRLAAGAATVITSNPDDQRAVARDQAITRDSIRVVPPGVDTRTFEFDSDARTRWRDAWGIQNTVIAAAGRFTSGKGLATLIDAFARLRGSNVDATLVLAGNGPERDACIACARRLGIADHVQFVAFVDHMPGFLSAADVFVSCSDTESFGLSIAEAMACRRAVVATPTAGAKSLIEHGENGYLLEDHSVETLRTGSHELCDSPRARERLGKEARRSIVEQFSIDKTLSGLLNELSLKGSSSPMAEVAAPNHREVFA